MAEFSAALTLLATRKQTTSAKAIFLSFNPLFINLNFSHATYDLNNSSPAELVAFIEHLLSSTTVK